jgi:hypothetical protein
VRFVSARPLAAALLALAVAGSAAATAATTNTAPAPAVGTATSELTLLNLSVAGQPLSVGHLLLNTSRDDGTSVFTALTNNGTSYGEHSLSAGSVAIPSVDSDTVLPTTLSKLVTVLTPAASMSAGTGTTRAGFDSLGSVSILGLPLALDGTLTTTAGVDGNRAGAEKTLVVRNLALPSIGGLLGALGLDITKLPSSTLNTLVTKLGIVDGTIAGARSALDAALGPLQPQLTQAEQQVADAQAAVKAAQDSVTSTTAQVQAATAALDAATKSLQSVLGTTPHLVRGALLGLPSPSPLAIVPTAVPTVVPTAVPTVLPTALPSDIPSVLPTALPTDLPTAVPTTLPTTLPSLPAVLPAGAQPAIDAYNAAAAAYTAALDSLNAATGALNLANGVLNTASDKVNALLTTVQVQVDALVHAIVGVLGHTPLVSIDSFTIRTEASATTAATGGQTAKVVGGEIQGVHVLGNDVLQQTTGRDRIDVGLSARAQLVALNATIDTLAKTFSDTLSNVTGLPTLSVPAPNIDLLSVSTATNIVGGFGTARTTLQALQITMPAITIPAALQKTPVGTLSVKAVGDVLSKPLSVAVGTMQDTASFRPSAQAGNTGTVPPGSGGGSLTNPPGTGAGGPTANGPSTNGPSTGGPNGSNPNGTPIAGGPGTDPQLPRTGFPAGAAILALGLVGAGLVLARSSRTA